MHTLKSQLFHKHSVLACFSDKSPSQETSVQRNIYYKYINCTCTILRIYKGSYKCNNMAIMVCMMLTHYWLKFIYKPLSTMCVVIYTQIFTIDVFLQKYPVPVPCIDVTCVGRCCVLQYSPLHLCINVCLQTAIYR